jgi:hypothetical protein
MLIPAALTAGSVTLLRFWTASMGNPWLVILLALGLSYAIFGSFALAYALDPDDQMIARSVWVQLRGNLQRLRVRDL